MRKGMAEQCLQIHNILKWQGCKIILDMICEKKIHGQCTEVAKKTPKNHDMHVCSSVNKKAWVKAKSRLGIVWNCLHCIKFECKPYHFVTQPVLPSSPGRWFPLLALLWALLHSSYDSFWGLVRIYFYTKMTSRQRMEKSVLDLLYRSWKWQRVENRTQSLFFFLSAGHLQIL